MRSKFTAQAESMIRASTVTDKLASDIQSIDDVIGRIEDEGLFQELQLVITQLRTIKSSILLKKTIIEKAFLDSNTFLITDVIPLIANEEVSEDEDIISCLEESRKVH